MTTKKATNPLVSQINDAKKSVKDWPSWMQDLAYFSTTSGTLTPKSYAMDAISKTKAASATKKK